MTVFVVALGKGGPGKTITAAEMIAELTRRGRRVLAIDADQQGNLSTRLGVTPETPVESVTADVLTGESSIEDAAIEAPSVPGAHVLVGTHDLASTTSTSVPDLVTSLRDGLPDDAVRWDDVVIDTPPSLGDVTMAALAAADAVVVPIDAVEALDQLERLREVTEYLGRRTRPGLEVGWIIPTRHDRRRRLDRELVELLTESWDGRVAPPVREAVAVRDSYAAGLPVSLYAPESAVAADYAAALAPIIARAGGGGSR